MEWERIKKALILVGAFVGKNVAESIVVAVGAAVVGWLAFNLNRSYHVPGWAMLLLVAGDAAALALAAHHAAGRRRARKPDPRTVDYHDGHIVWRGTIVGGEVTKVEPLCPMPGCRQPLRIQATGGHYPNDAHFDCKQCGFVRREEVTYHDLAVWSARAIAAEDKKQPVPARPQCGPRAY